MDWEAFKKHQAFAGPTKPSMHRRRVGHDYQSRRIYLITMTVEGRRPLLGSLVGEAHAAEGSDDAPRIVPTELGRRVGDCWWDIPRYYPDIKPLALQLMPDHLHGILFVQQHMDVHMSQAVKGFKTGTNKIYRELLPSVATMSRQRQEDMGGYRHEGFLWAPGFNDHILEELASSTGGLSTCVTTRGGWPSGARMPTISVCASISTSAVRRMPPLAIDSC